MCRNLDQLSAKTCMLIMNFDRLFADLAFVNYYLQLSLIGCILLSGQYSRLLFYIQVGGAIQSVKQSGVRIRVAELTLFAQKNRPINSKTILFIFLTNIENNYDIIICFQLCVLQGASIVRPMHVVMLVVGVLVATF